LTNGKKLLKKQKIRNCEYYDMQSIFDELYADSKKGCYFCNIVEIMKQPENIKLAYRNIKKNKGSKTAGTDKKTISDLSKWKESALIAHVQKKLDWYIPNTVRRVEIPKENGKTRPLGIPDAGEGVSQPLTHIKSFFDYVNHGKLLKQMWTLGIRDKKLLSILSAMLKAEVAGIGFPEKGTPQGGIISPLLSNIVLNELDWWIVSQWEEMPTKKSYIYRIYANGTADKSAVIAVLRNKTKLKECYVVRYADDFKIFCKKYSDSVKMFESTKKWLKDRLNLQINTEKSKIVNLKRHFSEFLGFQIKVRIKGKKKNGTSKYVVKACVKRKALLKIKKKCKEIIGNIRQTYHEQMEYKLIQKYNAYLIGVHNYYCIATHVNPDFGTIAFDVKKSLYNRLKHRLQKRGNITNKYIKEKYGASREVRYLNGHAIVPIAYVQHRVPMDKKLKINSYTPEGRAEIHKNLSNINMSVLYHLMNTPLSNASIEYNDNRIALYVAQKGKCAVTGVELEANQVACHHKIPKQYDGKDEYNNLIIVSNMIHVLIHAVNENTIKKYLNEIQLNKKQLNKLNQLRKLANMQEIVI